MLGTLQILIVLIDVLAYAFFIAIMVRVVFSWIGPSESNFLYRLSYDLTEPVLAPIRNLLPGRGMGIDFSPMIVNLALFMLINIHNRVAAP